jgi:hypothetical protein
VTPHLAPRNLARFAGGRFEKIVKGPGGVVVGPRSAINVAGKTTGTEERKASRIIPAGRPAAGPPKAWRGLRVAAGGSDP